VSIRVLIFRTVISEYGQFSIAPICAPIAVGGREEGRTGGQEDRRTGGQEDRRTGGREEGRKGGREEGKS